MRAGEYSDYTHPLGGHRFLQILGLTMNFSKHMRITISIVAFLFFLALHSCVTGPAPILETTERDNRRYFLIHNPMGLPHISVYEIQPDGQLNFMWATSLQQLLKGNIEYGDNSTGYPWPDDFTKNLYCKNPVADKTPNCPALPLVKGRKYLVTAGSCVPCWELTATFMAGDVETAKVVGQKQTCCTGFGE